MLRSTWWGLVVVVVVVGVAGAAPLFVERNGLADGVVCVVAELARRLALLQRGCGCLCGEIRTCEWGEG